MTDWQPVHGSQDIKPSEFDSTSSAYYVYQRRNVQRVTTTDFDGNSYEYWQYEERKLTHAEYNALRADLLEQELTNTQLALVDLYENLLGGNSNG